MYVDDGSTDRTLSILRDIACNDSCAKIVSFSGNFGHQAALTAGLKRAVGDAIVSLDVDLQDPPAVVEEMVCKFKEGYEIVFGVRSSRKKDTLFK